MVVESLVGATPEGAGGEGLLDGGPSDDIGVSDMYCGELNPQQILTPRRSPRLLNKSRHMTTESVGGDVVDEVAIEEPVVGMLFSSMIDVEVFYKRYAKSKGFGVIRPQGSYTKSGERRATTWRCECHGDPDSKIIRKSKKKAKDRVEVENKDTEECNPRRRTGKKCFCTAKIYVVLTEAKQWVIKDVVLEHLNHNPVPSDAKLVKEYRMEHMTKGVRRRLDNDFGAGVPIGKTYCSMANERGGYDNMPFTEADARHVVHVQRKLKMGACDSNALVSYFERMRELNSNFYHTHRLDDEGYMKDILWVEARSIAAYEEFSDVVCFDTTYLTNQYALPFANFVGVNHHGQSVLFGCALISKEDCDTFEWVFRKWLFCMKGKAPGGILTDQAAAMRRPLEEVMPDTRHRWCVWHIMQKLPYKLGSHKSYLDLKDDLLDIVYNSLNNATFESRWDEFLIKYGLEADEWLESLFVERHIWVPSFMTDHFWAGMRSTQRVESINSFFDQFVNRDTMLCEFGESYVAAVEKRIAQEKEADQKITKYYRHYSTGYSVERFFRKYYTSNIFGLVQKECERVTYCMIEECEQVDDVNLKYLMQDRKWVLPKDQANHSLTDYRLYYCLEFNSKTSEATCSCKMFETAGIICRHLVRLYDKLQIEILPEKYILHRWRKDVVRKHASVRVAFHDLTRTEEVKRLDRIVVACEPVTDLGVKSERCTQIVLKGLRLIEEECVVALHEEEKDDDEGDCVFTSAAESNGISPSSTNGQPDTEAGCQVNLPPSGLQSQGSVTVGNEQNLGTPSTQNSSLLGIKDPPIPKKRGRPRGSRFKTSAETGWKPKKAAQDSSPCKDCGCVAKGKGKKTKKTKCTQGKGKKKFTIDEGLVPGWSQQSGADKIQVKRRKIVSFVADLDGSENVIPIQDDDFLDRNGLTFSELD